MSIKLELQSFVLGGVAPYGWHPFPGKWNGSIMGHEFTMVGTFKLKLHSSFIGKNSQTIADLPALSWREREFWWERNHAGGWDFKGETDKGDLYQSNPGSPTWGGFAQGVTDVRGKVYLSDPGYNINPLLRGKLLTMEQRALVTAADLAIQALKGSSKYKEYEKLSNTPGKRNEGQLKLWWLVAEKLADKHTRIPVAALDRPGMALSGGSGQSGGGFTSGSTSPSRRRVLQFDLGVAGQSTRFTATQILETQDGKPTISKFIIPGQSDNWCKAIPEKYLEYWRGKLNTGDVYSQTHDLENEGIVDHWIASRPKWVPGRLPPKPTGWVKGRIPGR